MPIYRLGASSRDIRPTRSGLGHLHRARDRQRHLAAAMLRTRAAFGERKTRSNLNLAHIEALVHCGMSV